MVVSALLASKDTVTSFVHPWKAPAPIVLMPAGMVILVRAADKVKAQPPMVVQRLLAAKETVLRVPHSRNA